jgi:hypothetical protein
MKTMTTGLIVMLLLAGGLLAQQPVDIKSAGMDLLAAMNGDMERFERGMQTLESLLEKNPKDPAVMVLHGNGVFARSGMAYQKGDIQNAVKLSQVGLDEMARAVELAPDDLFVRARRGVLLITVSRSMPPAIAGSFTKIAVEDFERVLQIREKEQTLAQRSLHQRGELLTGLADGWSRLGEPEKARGYFERITHDLKGTIYEQKAKAWLEDRPQAKTPEYFACSGCHVE